MLFLPGALTKERFISVNDFDLIPFIIFVLFQDSGIISRENLPKDCYVIYQGTENLFDVTLYFI